MLSEFTEDGVVINETDINMIRIIGKTIIKIKQDESIND